MPKWQIGVNANALITGANWQPRETISGVSSVELGCIEAHKGAQ